jgi:hypothetical protein
MLRALFILDCAGELGPGAALSGAIDALIDAPNAADMTPQERAEFAGRLDAYQAAVTIAQARPCPSHSTANGARSARRTLAALIVPIPSPLPVE